MIVYRVEDKDGLGPYVHTNLQDKFEDLHDKWDCITGLRPTPSNDRLSVTYNTKEKRLKIEQRKNFYSKMLSSKTRYGFQSKKLLDAWFIKEMREFLTDKGYGISTYKVAPSYMILYQQQCCFLLTAAEKLSHEPFKEE